MKTHLYTGGCKSCDATVETTVTPREGHDYLPLAVWLDLGECPVCGYSGLSLALWGDDETTEDTDE